MVLPPRVHALRFKACSSALTPDKSLASSYVSARARMRADAIFRHSAAINRRRPPADACRNRPFRPDPHLAGGGCASGAADAGRDPRGCGADGVRAQRGGPAGVADRHQLWLPDDAVRPGRFLGQAGRQSQRRFATAALSAGGDVGQSRRLHAVVGAGAVDLWRWHCEVWRQSARHAAGTHSFGAGDDQCRIPCLRAVHVQPV